MNKKTWQLIWWSMNKTLFYVLKIRISNSSFFFIFSLQLSSMMAQHRHFVKCFKPCDSFNLTCKKSNRSSIKKESCALISSDCSWITSKVVDQINQSLPLYSFSINPKVFLEASIYTTTKLLERKFFRVFQF